jgi:ElaA protein
VSFSRIISAHPAQWGYETLVGGKGIFLYSDMIQWQLKQYEELTVPELYEIMRLRQEVFVVEQKCAFIDADGKDQHCQHLSGYLNGRLITYARIVPPGVSYPEPSLGRIVSSTGVRGQGYGRQLMDKALEVVQQIHGPLTLKIEAQLYLKSFYESYGFVAEGEHYILDDILHIEMLRK